MWGKKRFVCVIDLTKREKKKYSAGFNTHHALRSSFTTHVQIKMASGDKNLPAGLFNNKNMSKQPHTCLTNLH